jgi:phage terminase large subunit-like protein
VDVVEGKVVCCENIKLACKRFLSDLERVDLEFREDVADRAIDFIGILKHFAGKSSG